VAARLLTTCGGGDALRSDWCGSPPLVWVELPPPSFGLVSAAMMDMLACCSLDDGGGRWLNGWLGQRLGASLHLINPRHEGVRRRWDVRVRTNRREQQ
jgi:hypothetical protein